MSKKHWLAEIIEVLADHVVEIVILLLVLSCALSDVIKSFRCS